MDTELVEMDQFEIYFDTTRPVPAETIGRFLVKFSAAFAAESDGIVIELQSLEFASHRFTFRPRKKRNQKSRGYRGLTKADLAILVSIAGVAMQTPGCINETIALLEKGEGTSVVRKAPGVEPEPINILELYQRKGMQAPPER